MLRRRSILTQRMHDARLRLHAVDHAHMRAGRGRTSRSWGSFGACWVTNLAGSMSRRPATITSAASGRSTRTCAGDARPLHRLKTLLLAQPLDHWALHGRRTLACCTSRLIVCLWHGYDRLWHGVWRGFLLLFLWRCACVSQILGV